MRGGEAGAVVHFKLYSMVCEVGCSKGAFVEGQLQAYEVTAEELDDHMRSKWLRREDMDPAANWGSGCRDCCCQEEEDCICNLTRRYNLVVHLLVTVERGCHDAIARQLAASAWSGEWGDVSVSRAGRWAVRGVLGCGVLGGEE